MTTNTHNSKRSCYFFIWNKQQIYEKGLIAGSEDEEMLIILGTKWQSMIHLIVFKLFQL